MVALFDSLPLVVLREPCSVALFDSLPRVMPVVCLVALFDSLPGVIFYGLFGIFSVLQINMTGVDFNCYC